jgi:4-amino-4-deoxy-L-arabinose transferase-like glycosyltransferase
LNKKPSFTDVVFNEKFQLFFLTLFALTVFFAKLGLNGLANYDDCFYAEEAKEILKTGNWIILHYNGGAAYHNAPLFMWLVALSYKVFGLSVFAAKFPSALMGFMTVFLIYYLGRILFDANQAFLAAFILSTTYPFFKYARHSMLDVTLAFFVTLAMLALVLALRKNDKFFWLWGLAIGLAILTKSAFGVFPLIITFLFLPLAGRWKTFINPHFWGGVATALVIAGAWVASQYMIGGQDFINMHLKFIIMGKVSDDTPEAWYAHLGFIKDLFIFYWPWIPVAIYGLVRIMRGDLKDRETTVLLVLWSLTVLVVMSCMKTRYIWYLMQSLPALALVSANGLYHWAGIPSQQEKVFKGIFILGLSAVVLLNFLPYALDRDREADTRILAPYVKYFGDKGDRVIALREEFYGLNNAMLFFSDHAAEPLYQNVADIQKEFAVVQPVLCVAHRVDLDELQKSGFGWYPVKYANDLILIANQKLDVNDIPTWSGLWQN